MSKSIDTYLSNPLLKKAHVSIEFEPWQVEEYIKCSKDIVYFINNYVKIINLDLGLVRFELREYQQGMATTIADNRFTVIKTCRQAGKTTTAAATILWHILFNESYSVAILANKERTAREILSRLQRAYENLPKWLQQGVIGWAKTSIELENGSTVLAASTSNDAIRGMSVNFLYLDEFAFVQRGMQEEFFESVYPTIISGSKTKVVITSTPKGFDLFHKIWINAVEKRNDYVSYAVNWWDVPDYVDGVWVKRDEEWKKRMIANTSELQFRQEFEAEFLGSSDTLISPTVLAALVHYEPVRTAFDFCLNIYEEPKKGHVYFCTVDTARGSGIDASAFVIFDLTEVPYKVVATYNSNLVTPLYYPDIIHNVCRAYNDAMCLVEINDIGQQVVDILYTELEYENIIFTQTKGARGQVIGGGYAKRSNRGVRTTPQVKRIGCAIVKTMVESDKLVLNDHQLISELSTFIKRKASYQADDGYHDDLVMCLVLLAWASQQDFFKEITNTDFRQKFLEYQTRQADEDHLAFAFHGDVYDHPENINTIDNFNFDDQNDVFNVIDNW